MSGILEMLLGEVQALRQQLAAGAAQQAAYVAPGALGPGPGYVAPQQPVTPPTVTAEQITALIQPHIGNEQIKAALGVAMRSMGINALPETQPHQFAPLYAAFQGVITQYTGGGVAPQPGGSII